MAGTTHHTVSRSVMQITALFVQPTPGDVLGTLSFVIACVTVNCEGRNTGLRPKGW